MHANIASPRMIEKAISFALPSAQILWKAKDPSCRGVVIAVWTPGMAEPYVKGSQGLGNLNTLLERFEWDFLKIALEKLEISRLTGKRPAAKL